MRATASVYRRRPWNGELCRFVQPAASWCAPTRYEACRSRPSARLRQTSAPNKTTNFVRRPLRRESPRNTVGTPRLLPRLIPRAQHHAPGPPGPSVSLDPALFSRLRNVPEENDTRILFLKRLILDFLARRMYGL